MKKPNLFIPGVPKSGTSSLHSILCQHPMISGGVSKEPHTYSWDIRYKNRFDFFNDHYSNLKTSYILESSTSYLVSKHAIARILKDTPDAKFIIIARDPIDRIVSHYNWLSSLGLINRTFELEIAKHKNEVFNHQSHYRGNYKAYIDFSKYGKQLKSKASLLNNSNCLFIEYEAFFKSPKIYLDSITAFLNLNSFDFSIEKTNVTRKPNEHHFKVLKSNRKALYLLKYWVKALLGRPRHKEIFNPKPYVVSRAEAEDICLPILKSDIEVFMSMGYEVRNWKSISALSSR